MYSAFNTRPTAKPKLPPRGKVSVFKSNAVPTKGKAGSDLQARLSQLKRVKGRFDYPDAVSASPARPVKRPAEKKVAVASSSARLGLKRVAPPVDDSDDEEMQEFFGPPAPKKMRVAPPAHPKSQYASRKPATPHPHQASPRPQQNSARPQQKTDSLAEKVSPVEKVSPRPEQPSVPAPQASPPKRKKPNVMMRSSRGLPAYLREGTIRDNSPSVVMDHSATYSTFQPCPERTPLLNAVYDEPAPKMEVPTGKPAKATPTPTVPEVSALHKLLFPGKAAPSVPSKAASPSTTEPAVLDLTAEDDEDSDEEPWLLEIDGKVIDLNRFSPGMDPKPVAEVKVEKVKVAEAVVPVVEVAEVAEVVEVVAVEQAKLEPEPEPEPTAEELEAQKQRRLRIIAANSSGEPGSDESEAE